MIEKLKCFINNYVFPICVFLKDISIIKLKSLLSFNLSDINVPSWGHFGFYLKFINIFSIKNRIIIACTVLQFNLLYWAHSILIHLGAKIVYLYTIVEMS